MYGRHNYLLVSIIGEFCGVNNGIGKCHDRFSPHSMCCVTRECGYHVRLSRKSVQVRLGWCKMHKNGAPVSLDYLRKVYKLHNERPLHRTGK